MSVKEKDVLNLLDQQKGFKISSTGNLISTLTSKLQITTPAGKEELMVLLDTIAEDGKIEIEKDPHNGFYRSVKKLPKQVRRPDPIQAADMVANERKFKFNPRQRSPYVPSGIPKNSLEDTPVIFILSDEMTETQKPEMEEVLVRNHENDTPQTTSYVGKVLSPFEVVTAVYGLLRKVSLFDGEQLSALDVSSLITDEFGYEPHRRLVVLRQLIKLGVLTMHGDRRKATYSIVSSERTISQEAFDALYPSAKPYVFRKQPSTTPTESTAEAISEVVPEAEMPVVVDEVEPEQEIVASNLIENGLLVIITDLENLLEQAQKDNKVLQDELADKATKLEELRTQHALLAQRVQDLDQAAEDQRKIGVYITPEIKNVLERYNKL